jgi:hypothetical protein
VLDVILSIMDRNFKLFFDFIKKSRQLNPEFLAWFKSRSKKGRKKRHGSNPGNTFFTTNSHFLSKIAYTYWKKCYPSLGDFEPCQKY